MSHWLTLHKDHRGKLACRRDLSCNASKQLCCLKPYAPTSSAKTYTIISQMSTLEKLKTKYVGDSAFYGKILKISVPIMLQTGITNLVSFLDNIMVGRTGTEQMSGVAIVNQLIFVFFLCIFGGLAGAGLFTAQYYGSKDHEGIRQTIRYKLILGALITAVAITIFLSGGEKLISLYLSGNTDAGGDPAAAMAYAKEYLLIILFSLPAFTMVQVYSNTLRECSQTVVPMKAGMAAVAVNVTFNYLLIFGKFGFPEMGVRGAALATVLARYTEFLIVAVWTHRNKELCPYFEGVYSRFSLKGELVKKFFITGFPLLVNETLWSSGIAILTQCYSLRGLSAVAAQNISGTVSNVFNVVFFAMGDAVAIIIGQHLGAGDFKRAREEDARIIAFAVFIATIVGILLFSLSGVFPRFYNTTDEAKLIACHFLMAQAVFSPQVAFLHTTYFTLRAGGNTVITFLFDSFFMWIVSVPLAYFVSRHTDIYVVWIYVILQMADWIKCIIGHILVKKGGWVKKIVR